MELFEADTATLAQAQGQGKVFKGPFTPTKFSWDIGDERRFAVGSSGMSVTKYYTVTAFDLDKNTSEFSGQFTAIADPDDNGNPNDDGNPRVIGDVPCLTAEWFMHALDGVKINGSSVPQFTGDPWSVDSDGDGKTNLKEDKNQNCVVDSGETDPTKYDSSLVFTKIPPPLDFCPDEDKDGIYCDDNCPMNANPDQKDSDKDGIGDVCEGDFDGDGISDDNDNCIEVPNIDQKNTDGDPLGDACDPDDDNDGLTDDEETEAGTSVTDPDTDGDGYCDGTDWGYEGHECKAPMDNCPTVANPDQKDADGDGIGDKCDKAPNESCSTADSDSDGVADYIDNCPRIANGGQSDDDGDGNGNTCDFFDNVAGTPYSSELTRFYGAMFKNDLDTDNIKDDVDTDRDGDGILNTKDKCPADWNKTQMDSDLDGLPDACDDYDDLNNLSYADESRNFTIKWWVKLSATQKKNLLNHADCDADDDDIVNKIDNCAGVAAVQADSCFPGRDEEAPAGAHACWNFDQRDTDKDGLGDVCDNCTELSNNDQADLDGDRIGDACDDDVDGDGIKNADDNCPLIYNPNQADADGDGVGDKCDASTGIDFGITQPPVNLGWGEIEGGGSYTSSGGCSNISGSAPVGSGMALLFLLPLIIATSLREAVKRRSSPVN